jgi:hypothetical protein
MDVNGIKENHKNLNSIIFPLIIIGNICQNSVYNTTSRPERFLDIISEIIRIHLEGQDRALAPMSQGVFF